MTKKLDLKNPEPGIYTDVSFVDYINLNALSRSQIVKMRQSPKHFHWALTHPEEITQALLVGDATHARILEPSRYKSEYAQMPDFKTDPALMAMKSKDQDKPVHPNSTIYKEAVGQWQAAHLGSVALTADEAEAIDNYEDAIEADPMAHELLQTAKGGTELTIVYERFGIMLKTRLDRYIQFRGFNTIVDLKTTKSVFPPFFGKSVSDYAYDTQVAMYLQSMSFHQDVERRFLFVAVEKAAPFDVVIYEMEPEDIEVAAKQLDEWLLKYKECLSKNSWPGVGEGKILPVTMPSYRKG